MSSILCCAGPSYAPVDTSTSDDAGDGNAAAARQNKTGIISCLDSLSDFPGCTRQPMSNSTSQDAKQVQLIHTPGGALVEADANGGKILRVTVPDGTKPGMRIDIVPPGTNIEKTNTTTRTFSVIVPSGMEPGSIFVVQLPPAPDDKNVDSLMQHQGTANDGSNNRNDALNNITSTPMVVTGIPVGISAQKNAAKDTAIREIESELKLEPEQHDGLKCDKGELA